MNHIEKFSPSELAQLLANLQLCHAQLRKWAAVLPSEEIIEDNCDWRPYKDKVPKLDDTYPAYPFVCCYAKRNLHIRWRECELFVHEHFPKDVNKLTYFPFYINHRDTMRRIALCNRLISAVRKQIKDALSHHEHT